MRQNNTSGIRVNNTQTTPRAKKSRTAFYRCHLKANKPLFIWGKIQKSAILFAELKTLCKFVLPSHPISGISEKYKTLFRACSRFTSAPAVVVRMRPSFYILFNELVLTKCQTTTRVAKRGIKVPVQRIAPAFTGVI